MLWLTVLCVSLCMVHAQQNYQTYFPAFAPIYNDGVDIEIQEYKNAITISTATTAYPNCGNAISGIGDINDDGIDDYAYSCPNYDSSKGAVVVIFGGSDLLESDFTYPTSLSSSDGFTVHGNTSDQLGDAIVGNFDYNMDGVNDFLVCAAYAYSYNGVCYVILGHGKDSDYPFKDISLNDTSYESYNQYWFYFQNDFSALGQGRFGSSVASGDVNGDGFNDIIIGSSSYQSTNYVVVLYSKRGFVDDYQGNAVFLSEQLTGVFAKVYRSSNVASWGYTLSCGDFNQDGYADILVGTKASYVYIIWGSSTNDPGGGGPSIGSLSFSDINDDDTTTDLYSSRLLMTIDDDFIGNSSKISVIYGSRSSFGSSVTSLDFNGDGYDDMAIGDDGGTTESPAGAVYIIFGSSSPFITFSISTGTLSQMAVIYGDSERLTGFGTILASAGDINDDGYDDILVGGQGVTSYYALAYVIYGVSSDSTPLNTSMLSAEARGVLFYSSTTSYTYSLKYIVASIGDVNDDGINDIAMSTPSLNQVFVVFGSTTYFKRATLAPSYEPTYKPSVSIDDCEYYIKNYAGIAPPSSVDESIPVSEFNPLYVRSIAVDSGGNIYFLDMRENTYIRKYTKSTKSVSVVVGGGTRSVLSEIISEIAGTDLNLGMGMIQVTLRVDSNDDLIFAYSDGVYRLSASTGTVSKIIGSLSNSCDYNEGPVSALSVCAITYGFNLAVDSSDNVYFFDYNYFVIRKYSAENKKIQTIAGTGEYGLNFTSTFVSGTSAEGIALPYIEEHAIDITTDGIIYFTYKYGLYSLENDAILLLTSSSYYFSSADYYDLGSYSLLSTAKIRSGSDGNLYISQMGLITQVSIAVDSYMGSQYIAKNIVGDGSYYSHEGFASSGGTNTSTTGLEGYNSFSSTSGFVRDVEDICFEQGILYIADNSKFIRQVKNGNFSVVVGQATVGDDVLATNAHINYFTSMAWDSYNNYLYVADTKSYQVHRISSDGILENYVGVSMPNMRDKNYYTSDWNSRTSTLIEPVSVAVDSDGLLYFDDKLANIRRIRMVTYSGQALSVVGSEYTYSTSVELYSTSATSISLNIAGADAGIAIYNKNLYFVNYYYYSEVYDYDEYGYYIGKFDMEENIVTIFAGSALCVSTDFIYDNCPMAEGEAATNAHIRGIQALTVDSEGNVYYYDNSAYIIRYVSSAGIVTTIAGTGSNDYSGTCYFPYYNSLSSSSSSCYGISSNINALSALAVDVYSNVYFGYAYDNNVFKIDGETGLMSTFFSSQSSGWSYNGDTLLISDAYISGVSSLAYDGENLYIADVYNQLVRKMVCGSSYFSFYVEYNLVGVTEAQYNEDSETNDMVFKLSFISAVESEGISGLTTGDIVITDVQDVDNIMAKYVIVMLPIARALFSSGIKITSQVVVFPNVIGYSQSSGAFTALSNAITNSYTSGAFASSLSTYSSTYNSVLISATPSTIVSPSISGYTGSDDDDYTVNIDKVYPTPPYKSFAMLIGLDRDTSGFDFYCAIATPIIFTLWMIGIGIVMFNTEHSEYQGNTTHSLTHALTHSLIQGLFFVAFSVLSTLNMYFDTGNVTSSWFVDWASLWMSILFSWLLPATYVFILTIIKHELFPWFVTDYFIGRVLSRDYGVTVFWFWLSHTKGLPLINNKKQSFSFENHDSLPKVVLYIISWILLIVCQLICLVPFALWVAILSPYYIMMFVVGIFLFQTKLMVNNTIWNTWCALFTSRASRYAKNVAYDTRFFNETLLCEFLLQSIPQLIIKFVNNAAIEKERSLYVLDYTYALSTPVLSIISAIILFIRYVVLVVVFDREILDVPFFFKVRYKGNTLKYGIKKSPHDFAANKEAREAYLEYWTRVHNNCKADLLYLGTYHMLRYVFFKIEDSDNASLIKKKREPLLLALRQKDMYDVSSLALATDTMHYLLKDSKDMKLYRYLQSVEVLEPIDLLDITEDTLNGILKCINHYKVKEIVNANLHILLLSNLVARDSLLVKDASISSKHLSSKFGSNKYRQLMFPLLKIDGQVDLGVFVDDEGLYVCELGEISLKAGIALNDRVLAVNGTKVKTVEDYNTAVEESNVSVEHHNNHNQVRILVARVNNSFNEQRPGSTSDDLYNVFRKSTLTFHSNRGRKSMYSSLMNIRQEHVDADAIMKMNDRQLLKMFKKIDKDDSGTIEEPELQRFLEELHVGGAKTAKSMMDLVDVNGDGEITKEEFLIMMHKIQGKEEPQSQNVSVDIPVEDEVQAVESPHQREYNPFKLFRQRTEKFILGKKNGQDDDLTKAAPQYSQVEMTMQGQNEDDALA